MIVRIAGIPNHILNRFSKREATVYNRIQHVLRIIANFYKMIQWDNWNLEVRTFMPREVLIRIIKSIEILQM